MSCPLCAHSKSRPSWLGSTVYLGEEFRYVECLSCKSLYCDPMPDGKTLERMYGPEYHDLFHAQENMGGTSGVTEVLSWLRREGRGKFVDYGCGAGHLLHAAKLAEWNAIGIEFEENVATRISQRIGVPVITDTAELLNRPADVLHLGDIIEHLTELDRQMPEILRLLKIGGLLLAQGPLENNANLFKLGVKIGRQLRRGQATEMAPYHVLLTTAEGQRRLFRRFGLHELKYSISEAAWPAPAKIMFDDLAHPRSVGLYFLRRCSQALSAMRPHSWGNRYFYAGRRMT